MPSSSPSGAADDGEVDLRAVGERVHPRRRRARAGIARFIRSMMAGLEIWATISFGRARELVAQGGGDEERGLGDAEGDLAAEPGLEPAEVRGVEVGGVGRVEGAPQGRLHASLATTIRPRAYRGSGPPPRRAVVACRPCCSDLALLDGRRPRARERRVRRAHAAARDRDRRRADAGGKACPAPAPRRPRRAAHAGAGTRPAAVVEAAAGSGRGSGSTARRR